MTTVYIGPYLVIPNQQQCGVDHHRQCINSCDTDVTKNYCGECGHKIIIVETPRTIKCSPNIYDLADCWEDTMTCPTYGQNHPNGDVWLPNNRCAGTRIYNGEESIFVPKQINSINVGKELINAQATYGAFVQAVKDTFKIDPVWEYGIFVYGY